MAWSKVKKGKKPIGWWYHKVMCEIGYLRRNHDSWKMYYYHLNTMLRHYGINLYGQKIR